MSACPDCGFDPADWTLTDLRGTARMLPFLWEEAEAGDLVPEPAPPAGDDRADLEVTAHRLTEALQALGRLRQRPSRTGSLVQVSTSRGGVPKLPAGHAVIGRHGLDVDRQAARQHHGRPWQAVCLWSAEVIDDFAADGHSLGYGSAGENLTVRGLDWAQLQPGARVLAGTALLELQAYAVPCKKNAQWFSDGDFGRMAQRRAPGRSRVYARVLTPGEVRPGDPVVYEPS